MLTALFTEVNIHNPGNQQIAKELISPERATGIEPAYLAWEASALPLSYARDVVPKCIA